MMKQVAVVGTAVMTTLLMLVVFWQFHIVVVYVLISLALAATVRPLIVDWANSRFVTRLGLILLYLLGFGILGFLIFLVSRFAIGDLQESAQMLSIQGAWILPSWLEGSWIQTTLVAWLPTPDKLFEALVGEQGQFVLPAVLGFTEGIGGVISSTLLVFLLSIYWSTNQIHFERLWLSLLPSEQRKRARSIWRAIELDLGAYIRSEIIQSLCAVLLLGLGYWLFGSRYSTLLALIGALAWLIPVVGAALAVILPLLVGLSTSVQLGLIMTFYTLAVLIVLQIWVEPRLFRRKWNNPILTLVILLAMADVFGLIGILAAPPLSAACQILWNLLVSNPLASGSAVQISDLKKRQEQLKYSIEKMDELPPPLVVSSMERLASLLKKAESVLPAAPPSESPNMFHPSQPVSEEGATSVTTNP